MEFRILGPLEVSAGNRTLTLGGFKQRAVLGLLLLRANRVVATSELLATLWPDDQRPATARKIVQNAVWGLRALLAEQPAGASGPAPELLTQAPGYMLRVDPARVDLYRVDRHVAEGRAQLAANEPVNAARLLGEALAEWSGPPLADLAEEGIDWPELTALRQLRLDVMEDRFEAELRSGRHHAVLGELVSLADEEPLRERLCGQLMLALYRCGRQAEALSVFHRVRRALVEEYGLEPSRELQLLQQNILGHDPALAAPKVEGALPSQVPSSEPELTNVRALPALLEAAPAAGASAVGSPEARAPEARVPERPERARGMPPGVAQAVGGARVSARRPVAVLLVRTGFADEAEAFAGPVAALNLHDAVTAVAECAEEFGGTVAGSLGYVSVVAFGLAGETEAASTNAVRVALAVRDRIGALSGPACHAVVTAGEALVHSDPHDPGAAVSVVGRIVDEARSLLARVRPGEIHLCGGAVQATEGLVRHLPVEHPDARDRVRQVIGLSPVGGQGVALQASSGSHDAELAIMRHLLERTRRQDAPLLMTILGDPEVGKSRFLADFERDVSGEAVRVVRMRADGGAPMMMRGVLAASCGLPTGAAAGRPSGAAADVRFTGIVRRLAGHGNTAERLLRTLRPLLVGAESVGEPWDVLDRWCELLALLARELPLVLCLDDAHLAEDAVLDCVERLAATTRDVPLFMMVCARPELVTRRRFWGSGLRHVGTLTLDRISDLGMVTDAMIPLGSATPRSSAARGTWGVR